MLNEQELSGYDMKLLLDKRIHHIYWSPAKSQIYGELRRLEQAGWVTMTEVAQTNRPDKRVYQITEAGRTALHEWLASTENEPDVFKSPMMLHLLFGHLLPRETLATQLEARQRKLGSELTKYEKRAQELRTQSTAVDADPQLPYLLLSLEFQISLLQAAMSWTTETVTQFKRRKKTARSA
jgi:DNA-binding PadR family transcriptional regulator